MANTLRSKRKGLLKKKGMLSWEKKAFLEGSSIIIGVDEAGRGPLAGPVVAAAVTLKKNPINRFSVPAYRETISDSKAMSSLQREKSFCEIYKKSIFGIGLKSHKAIDRHNIHNATLSAMKDAISAAVRRYCRFNNQKEKDIKNNICVLIDGIFKPEVPYKTITITKGDSKSLSIAAASIVAKVTRDGVMRSYDKIYPRYGFSAHKGYGTAAHMEAIRKNGPCPIHRKTFAPLARHSDA